MIDGEQDQTQHDLQESERKVEQQLGEALLHTDGIEEAVHQFGQVAPARRLVLDARDAVRELQRATREEPLLDVLRQGQLHHLQGTREAHTDGDEGDEHAPTGGDLPTADQVDDGLHAERHAKADGPAHQCVQVDVADLALVRAQQAEKSLPGGDGVHDGASIVLLYMSDAMP